MLDKRTIRLMKFRTLPLVIVSLLVSTASMPAGAPAATNSTPVVKADAKATTDKATDWGALFKMHWQNRVRPFKEENLEWQHVVLLGDSITEGFEVSKYFPGRRALNRGIGVDVIGKGMPSDDPGDVLQRLGTS